MRPLKMAEYLSNSGHNVTVLTHSYRETDMSNNNVLRIYDISHNKNKRGIRKMLWFFLRLYSEILNYFGFYHSIYSWWKNRVLNRGEEIFKIVKPELIIATYPPVETLKIGLYFSKKYKIAFMSDFRDGLLFETIEKRRITKFKCVRKKYEKIERETLKNSSAVITVSSPISNYFINTYNNKNVLTIPNTFDPEDFKDLPEDIQIDSSKFNIVHTGRFAWSDVDCDITPFVNSIKMLVSKNPAIREKLRLHLIGNLKKAEVNLIEGLTKDGIVIQHGEKDRKIALSFQTRADLLLVITSITRSSVATSKIYEYLFSKTPILALTYKTYTEEIIKKTKSGWVVHPEDQAKIYQLIYKILREPDFYFSIKPDQKRIDEFLVKTQMDKLDKFLNKVNS